MTVRELIKTLQDLGDENLDREVEVFDKKVLVFDGPSYYTPYKVEVHKDRKWDKQFE